MFFTVEIEIQKDRYIVFITDNQEFVKQIQLHDFIISYGSSDAFTASVINFDADGFRMTKNVDEWIEGIAKSGMVGDFIVSKHYIDENKRIIEGSVYANGSFDKFTKNAILSAIKHLPVVTKSKKTISAKIGTTKTISENEPNDEELNENDKISGTILSRVKSPKEDVLYEVAEQLVIEQGQASVSLLQRTMKIGHTRAARLMDTLEERGIVGAYDGSRPREVLVRAALNV